MEIERMAMATKKEKWDGKSRPSTELYRKRFNEFNNDMLFYFG